MKSILKFRFVLAIITFTIALLFLSGKRKQLRRISNKETTKSGEPANPQISNTDYIFFQSLSKYLFIPLK